MSAEEFGGFGFAVGVVRGARSFKVDKLGRLTGVSYEQVWRPGENVAECRKDDGGWANGGITFQYDVMQRFLLSYGSQSPSVTVKPKPKPKPKEPTPHSMDTCKCGFYGYYDGSNDYYREGYVSAVVEGYGEAIIGTRGFRAAKARIVALRIPKHVAPRLAALIARNYPEIPLFDKFSSMVTEFPPDAGGQEITPTSDPKFWERKA